MRIELQHLLAILKDEADRFEKDTGKGSMRNFGEGMNYILSLIKMLQHRDQIELLEKSWTNEKFRDII